MRLAGKVAIVTGSARNIGRAIALTFAREGADVAIVDLNIEGAEATAEAVRALGRKAIAIQTDITDPEQVQQMVFMTTETLGTPTILVNNAVRGRFNPFLDLTAADWDVQYEVGLKGYFLCSQAVVRQLVAQKLSGSIISMTSIAALRSNHESTAYAAIKAGVIAMTQVMATELASQQIRVNAIAPGVVETDLARSIIKTEGGWSGRLARIPMNRFGLPEEIANGALYLASDEASYVTGHTLVIDGGFTPAGVLTN